MTKTLRFPKKQSLLLLAVFAVHGIFAQTIRYVNASLASGLNNGTSWANAYKDLQPALAAAQNGDQIWVAKGTYYPTATTTDRASYFNMKKNVAIYGGFGGYESVLSQRNWTSNVTILSGDIDRAIDPLVVTGGGATLNITGNAGNSNFIVYASGLDKTAILDGFTIIGGNGYNNLGGGINNYIASPSFSNLVLYGNSGPYGGGMNNIYTSSPIVTNVVFSHNYAQYGGGMNNNDDYSSPILLNIVFLGNKATYSGGGMLTSGTCAPTLTNVVFSSNSADQGGGMCNYTATLTNINNVTFFANNAISAGGGIFNSYSSSTINNSIFWGNTINSNLNSAGSDIQNGTGNTYFPTSATFFNSSLQFAFNSYNNQNIATINNIFAQNPLFVNAANPAGTDGIFGTSDDGLALQSTSPCINKGSNAAMPTSVTTDIAGLPRIMGGTVDMGAYESSAGVTTAFTGCPNVNLAIARPGYNTYKGEPMTIYNVDTTTGAAIVISGGPLKDPYTNNNMEVNGAGVNNQDGFVYAIHDTGSIYASSTFLYRIGANYGAVPLGKIAPPPVTGTDISAVDAAAGCFDADGNYYVIGGTGTIGGLAPYKLYIGKISSLSSLAPGTGTLSPTWTAFDFEGIECGKVLSSIYASSYSNQGIQDIAYSNLDHKIYMYMVFNTGLYRGSLINLDPVTGVASCPTVNSTIPFAAGSSTNEVSGIATTTNGNLIILLTGGDMYKIKPATNGNSISYDGILIKMGASGIASLPGQTGSIRGDLASCGFGKALSSPGIIIPQRTELVGYPNPARGFVTLSTNHTLSNATVRLVTLAGNVISETTGVSGNTFKMDLKGASGIYMVEVIEANGSSRLKIIKE